MSPSPEDDRAIDLALAGWLAKLGRADGNQHQRAFEDWLAQNPRRQAAYRAFKAADRDVARTSLPIPPLNAKPGAFQRLPFVPAAMAALVLLAIGGGGALLLERGPARDGTSAKRFAAGDAPRTVDLPDGPSLVLDEHAVVLTSFEQNQPILFIQRGRARIRLPASADRPYVVAAGDLRLTAHGAVFDIAQDGSAVRVTALSGGVVARHAHNSRVTSLTPGQQLVANSTGDQVMPAAKDEPNWTSALLPLDGKTLADLVAIGNRGHGKPILLGDTALGRKSVQGQLPVKDTHVLALQIAAAYDLDLRETQDEYILTIKS